MFIESGAGEEGGEINKETKSSEGQGSDESEESGESWRETHRRWQREEEREEAQKLKKYGPVIAACTLGMLGYGYYQGHQIEKANRTYEEKISNAPQNYVNFSDSRSNLTVEQKRELKDMLIQLQSMFPKGYIFEIEQNAILLESIKASIPKQPDVVGFEEIGVEKEDLKPVFNQEFFPKGFVNGNISKINYVEKTSGVGWSYIGAEAGFDNKTGNVVSFFRPSIAIFNENNLGKDQLRNTLWPITIHEFAHESDWFRKVSLNPEERAKFLFEAQKVFLNSRKYSTPIVDIASPEKSAELNLRDEKKVDKKEIFLHRLCEWWAELCTGYLEFPTVFQSMASDEEKQLVKHWLLKDDSTFDASKAYNERHRVWKIAKDKIYKKLVKKNMDADAGLRKVPNMIRKK